MSNVALMVTVIGTVALALVVDVGVLLGCCGRRCVGPEVRDD